MSTSELNKEDWERLFYGVPTGTAKSDTKAKTATVQDWNLQPADASVSNGPNTEVHLKPQQAESEQKPPTPDPAKDEAAVANQEDQKADTNTSGLESEKSGTDISKMNDQEMEAYLKTLSDAQLEALKNKYDKEEDKEPEKFKNVPYTAPVSDKSKSKPETMSESAKADLTTGTAYGWLLMYTCVPILGIIFAIINAFAGERKGLKSMSRGWLLAVLTAAAILTAFIGFSNLFHWYFLTDLLNSIVGNGKVVIQM